MEQVVVRELGIKRSMTWVMLVRRISDRLGLPKALKDVESGKDRMNVLPKHCIN